MNYDFSSHQHHSRDKFDPYDVLDLPRDADKDSIRQRFRRLTRVHHPDRNKNNPDYDPDHYARICSAYEILSDPRKRAGYDQQHASTWNTLRDQSINFSTPAAPRHTDFSHRGDFSQTDLRRFNEAFQKSRAPDPNDRGYGDQMVARASGTSIEDLQRARSMDMGPQNMFSSSKVSGGDFNARFEQEMKSRRQAVGSNMMERADDPLAWNGGSVGAGPAGSYSEVSIFDGMMIDASVDDFTQVGGATLDYSDYMSGFNTFSDQLPENHRYYDSNDVKKAFNERRAQLSQIPDRGHSRSFTESQALLEQQQSEQWKRQLERNKSHVLKYRDQYASDDLLPAPRVAPGGMPVDKKPGYNSEVMDRPRPRGGARGQHPVASAAREPIPLPDPSASFRPATSSAHADAGAINSRMLDRMMDNVRSPRWQ